MSILYVPDLIEFVTAKDWLGLSISPAQETLLRGLEGLPLRNDEQRELWRTGTGDRPYREGHQFPEATIVCGARSGKDSRIAAPVACYDATFGSATLAKGEMAVVPVVAQDARATRIAFGYIAEYFKRSPLLSQMIADERANELELTNGLTVVCFPCTRSSLRGWSIPTAIMDEVAFFATEGSAEADAEIQTSIRRGMVNFQQTRLLKISTPYSKQGILHADFEKSFGKDDPDLLVWRMGSLQMNPSLKASRLERERRLDPIRYQREFEAEWSDALASFLPAAWIDGAVVRGRHELARRSGTAYIAATDPTGGGLDAWPLLIAHVEGDGDAARIVVDVLRSHTRVGTAAPDLEGVVREYADILHHHGCGIVVGDRYSAQWVRQAFGRCGITYEDSPCDRSAAYLELQPWMAQGRVDLLDHPQLIRELKSLERRPRPGGKDAVDAPRGMHEDHANVLALAVAIVAQRPELGKIDGWIHRANANAPSATAVTASAFYGSTGGGSSTLEDLAFGGGGGSAFDLGRRAFGSDE